MCLLFDLPPQDTLDTFRKMKLLSVHHELHDIEFDADLSKEQYVEEYFREVKVSFALVRTRSIGKNMYDSFLSIIVFNLLVVTFNINSLISISGSLLQQRDCLHYPTRHHFFQICWNSLIKTLQIEGGSV